MRAIQLEEFGGPEAMQLVELPDPEPGEGEVVIEVTRAGINFADTHVTRNDYLAKQELPLIPGGEIAGRTPDGQRVAALVASGGYAERIAVPEAVLVPVPDGVSDDEAAGLLLQGLTARSLLRISGRLEQGDSVVVQAAAGGTGSLAVQLAKRMGAGRVIALASSEEKRELARRLGADVAVDSRAEDLEAAIVEANGGEPVDVVLEMSGGEAFEACLAALAPFGRLVTYGLASREPVEIRNVDLMRTSRAVVGFWLMHLFRRPRELRAGIAELLEAVAKGELEVVIGGTYPISEARRAHEAIASRATHGKLLLDPTR
ncbi:MAG TPA: zinc-binding dehydrogenase [Solirubrobacterales bacterium]|jgi:NADPH2:quinone reductase